MSACVCACVSVCVRMCFISKHYYSALSSIKTNVVIHTHAWLNKMIYD